VLPRSENDPVHGERGTEPAFVCDTLNEMGCLYSRHGHHDKALDHFQRAISTALALTDHTDKNKLALVMLPLPSQPSSIDGR
jgi:hypothetical protein